MFVPLARTIADLEHTMYGKIKYLFQHIDQRLSVIHSLKIPILIVSVLFPAENMHFEISNIYVIQDLPMC